MTPSLLRICSDGSVCHANSVVSSPTIYYIETLLMPARTTASGYEYYTSKVLDAQRQPIDNNTFEWNGIRCRLENRDVWAARRDVLTKPDALDQVDGIALAGYVTDQLGVERRVLCDNNLHNGAAWNKLLEYVREVSCYGTHAAMREIYNLRNEIAEQHKLYKALELKSQAVIVGSKTQTSVNTATSKD